MQTIGHTMDEFTKLPNFTQFFTENFDVVYGAYGTLLLIKCKPLREINDQFGYSAGDQLIKAVAKVLHQYRPYFTTCYRHEGNGFLVVFKETTTDQAQGVILALLEDAYQSLGQVSNPLVLERAYLYTKTMSYFEPLTSVADYYVLFYDELIQDYPDRDPKSLMHFVVGNLAMRVNQMVVHSTHLKRYALIDEVSQLPNYKSARLFLNEVTEEACDYGVLFIDGDHLRLFNEISYDCGNQAIQLLGRLICKGLRRTDRVFRWLSGDEFIVVAKVTSLAELSGLAERVRQEVEDGFRGREIEATVSIGLAICSPELTDFNQVIAMAEKANKMAKSKGRNCIVSYQHYQASCESFYGA